MSYSGVRATDDEDATERIVRGRWTSVWSMFSTSSTEQGLKRAMESRHVAMMALGATIKAAFFTNLSRAIDPVGPGNVLVSYAVVSLFVYTAITPLAEMAALFPVSGAFATFGSRFVSPALGFALGWLYCVQWILLIPNEMRVVVAILQNQLKVMSWQCALVVIVPVFLVQLIRIRIYGELQYWCVSLVVVVILLYTIISPIVSSGQSYSDFRDGRAFVGEFNGFLQALSYAVYSFEGIELVAVAAGESVHPWKTVPNAMKGTFFRIAFLYMLATGLTSQTSNSAFGEYVVNAVMVIAVLSAINSAFYGSSRMLFALARTGQAPRIFGWANERGVPVPALLMSLAVSLLAILTTIWSQDDILPTWLLNLTSISSLLLWGSIGLISFRFRAAWRAQGRSLDDLPYAQPMFPLLPICAVVLATLMFVSGGYMVIKDPPVIESTPYGDVDSTSNVVATFLGVMLFVVLYVGYGAYERFALGKRQHFVRLSEVDLDTDATWKAGDGMRFREEGEEWEKEWAD